MKPQAPPETTPVVRLPDGERTLPVLQHLEELRKRLWVGLGAVVLGTTASFVWAGRILAWLKKPAGDALPSLAFFSPTEGVVAYLKVAFLAGFVLAMPILLYEAWAFIRPGLSPRERRYGIHFIGWGSLLFLAGVAFAYGVLLPTALHFLLGFGTESLVPVISVSRYLGFVTTVLLASGAVFELPLGIFLLTRVGVITPGMLRARWRIAFLGMTIAAAILTPTPDVVNMTLLWVPLLVLYGISIGVSWLAMPRGQKL
ncbi:MAG: twin-arginine translocase subunit TatC [Candidatus Omnitrophica bacterium]|nr:twin-arginine translocase subunit TatC [Candidatus Omnitrophota bacterium]